MHGLSLNVEPDIIDRLREEASALRAPMVAFARRLIQTPSLPGQEGDVASLVAAEMQTLGYDQVTIDQAGNVIGRLLPTAGRPTPGPRKIMFNTHMDHVDVGDPARWPHPPYEAAVLDGQIWGRGSSDLKGPLATQVYAGALIKRAALPLYNDIYVAGVVQEEIGGLGSAMLADHLPVDYVIIGEPSANRLAIGHRGRIEAVATVGGKSVHASVPNSGVNPLYSMARFLLAVERIKFEPDPHNPALGATTIAPTLFSTDQSSPNVVPGECRTVLDIRNTPADKPDIVLERIEATLRASLEDGATGQVEILPITMTSYTGLSRTFSIPSVPFGISPKSSLVRQSLAILSAALGRQASTQVWRFATDAGHFAQHGVAVIGFGPGHEETIHTVNERISISMMAEALVAYAALGLALS